MQQHLDGQSATCTHPSTPQIAGCHVTLLLPPCKMRSSSTCKPEDPLTAPFPRVCAVGCKRVRRVSACRLWVCDVRVSKARTQALAVQAFCCKVVLVFSPLAHLHHHLQHPAAQTDYVHTPLSTPQTDPTHVPTILLSPGKKRFPSSRVGQGKCVLQRFLS